MSAIRKGKINKRPGIVIISRESNSRTLDISLLEAELIRRGCDVTVLSRLLTKEKSLKALGYAGHVLRQEAAILSSDVVVLDTYCIPASMLPHRKGTKVVQMWHALSAIKKFGWQTVGREDGSSEKVARLMKMHRGYDYVVCASDITAGHFCEAFRTDRSKVVKYGLPRIDYIKSVSKGSRREETAKKILAAYPQLGSGKKTVLYAPTFRKGRTVELQSLVGALDPEKYNIVIKLHPLYRSSGSEQSPVPAHVIMDESFRSYDWLSVADAVISDYSSFVVESTLSDRPLFIYAYDIENYEANTGLNVDFDAEPIAPYVFRDAEGLAEAIDLACSSPSGEGYDMDALRAFRGRYIDIDTGYDGPQDHGTENLGSENHCTAALAEFLISLADRP